MFNEVSPKESLSPCRDNYHSKKSSIPTSKITMRRLRAVMEETRGIGEEGSKNNIGCITQVSIVRNRINRHQWGHSRNRTSLMT
jgi:hypothetical protein